MGHVLLPDFNPGSLAIAAGPTSYARGLEYARQLAVEDKWWDDRSDTLHGYVRGSVGYPYGVTVRFSRGGGRLVFESGECSCPVGIDCKHVVALVVTAAGGAPEWMRATAALEDSTAKAEQPVTWQQSLETLLASSSGSGAGRKPAATPLGIELVLGNATPAQSLAWVHQAGPPEPRMRLSARLVRPGKNGGWVAGNLSWPRLDTLSFSDDYRADHLRLLGEIYGTYRSRLSSSPYYAYGAEKSIDLVRFESRQLWPLLDEAESIGLPLVYVAKIGSLDRYSEGEFCLDVTRGAGPADPLVITPSLRIDGAPTATPLCFIGSTGHGLVYVDGAPAREGETLAALSSRFRLAKLVKPVPSQLQQMALASQRLTVPSAEQARFTEEYYLRLRQATTVTSSDGSFTPPEISGPTLVLRAEYVGGHELQARWEWLYQVGDTSRAIAPDSAADGSAYRDLNAERAILADLDLPSDQFGLLYRGTAAGGEFALSSPIWLTGLDTMRFTTEWLPLLAGQSGVAVEVAGERADYREVGDSLLIGVSVDESTGDNDWFDLGITITVEGREIPFVDVFTALSRGQSHLLLDDGRYFSLEKPELQNLAKLIYEARALQDAPPSELKISRFQAGLWEELAELGVVSKQAASWRRQVDGLLSVGTLRRTEPPAGLDARLRPYQLDGFAWLAFLAEHGLGGILADDMGLGKTVQSLALLAHARETNPDDPPFLIVAPTSVVPNWAAESSRFAPGLKVATLTDTTARRGQPLAAAIAGADAVVTSYTLLRIDFDAYSALAWSGLILDEAQQAKNHQAKIYQCVRRLPAPFKVAITGTPIENNLMELWSLLSITAPGLFPNPAKFRDYYARPIENHGAQHAELLAQLRRRIKPLVLRRTKEQVASDLPAKQEQVLEVELHPRHRKVYQTHLQRERQKVLGLINDMNANRFTILRSLTLLRQLSLHAGLIDDDDYELPSAKIDAVAEHLRHVAASGHRALVFSQFTGFLRLVRERLDADAIPNCYLDGSTKDRAGEIRRFKEGAAPAFLISLKAGGFGLNLTEADYCFLLDPWWNPATETQAIDRTHRIGQTRNVMVYRLIAKDTIEQKVMAMKARKADLFTSVLDDGNVFGATLTADDIRGLLA
jgi:superfamily II DNA or RNA helicase